LNYIAGSDVRSSNTSQSGGTRLPDLPVVLVVEDDEPLQLVLHDGLKYAGFDVLAVASAREVLALLHSGVVKYSALITDIKLADGQTGWEVARQAREIDSSLVVVYASSAPAADWRAQGVPNSIFLGKPFAPAQLLTAVSQLLNGNARA
jgi:DNA-binding response OmpR family regulator